MEIVNLNDKQHDYLSDELSTIVSKYSKISYVDCIFTSIYKDFFKSGIKHMDVYIVPSTENHYEDLKTIINNDKQEEIYKETDFLLTVLVENPKDYENIRLLDLVRIDKLNRLRSSKILFDRNNSYRSLLEKYQETLDKCFNMIETNPKIKIKNKSE